MLDRREGVQVSVSMVKATLHDDDDDLASSHGRRDVAQAAESSPGLECTGAAVECFFVCPNASFFQVVINMSSCLPKFKSLKRQDFVPSR